jgi:hypothetical protein
VDARPGHGRPGHHPGRGQLHHHDHLHARARHDDVPDADLHLEHAGHQRPGPDGFPVLAAALRGWPSSTAVRAHVVFDPANGGAMLWQHLFWFFGHPEVYIIALPFFGIVSEIIPVFSRKPIFGYKGLVFATWPSRPCRWRCGRTTCTSPGGLPAVLRVHDHAHRGPDRREVLQLDRHHVGRLGDVRDADAVLIGFLITFLFGGLTGVMLASPPLDFHVSDSYFVVAHFHYVVFGTVVFADVRRVLLLVAEDDRPDARRAPRQGALLAAVHRLPGHLPGPALAGQRGHAPPLRRLPASGRLHHAEPGLHGRRVHPRHLDAAFLWNVFKTWR